MNWSNNYSNIAPSSQHSRPYGKISEEGAESHIHHILILPENCKLSVEELRLKDRRGNSYLRNYSDFNQGSVTPDKYSYLSGASRGLSSGFTSNNPFSSNSMSNNRSTSFNQSNPFAGQNSGFSQGNSFNTQSNPFNATNQNNPFASSNTNLGQSSFYRNPSSTSGSMNANSNSNFYAQNNPWSQSNPFSTQNSNVSGMNNNVSAMNNNASGINNPFGGLSSQSNPFSGGYGTGNSALAGKNQFSAAGNYANPFGSQGSSGNSFVSGQGFSGAPGGFFNSTQSVGGNQVSGNFGGSSFFAQTPGFLSSNPGFNSSTNSSNPFYSSQALIPSSNPSPFNFSNPQAPNSFYSQPLYSQNFLQSTNPNSFSFQDLHTQGLSQRPLLPSSFFKDPYGLSWIYPDRDPEEILKNYKPRDPKSVNFSVSQRILGTKAPTKFTEKKTPLFTSKPKPFKRPKKPLTFDFPVRDKFKEIKYEFVEDNGVHYMKKIEESPEQIDFIASIKGDKEFKVNLSISPANTVSEIKESIMKALNSVQDFNLKRGDKTLQNYETAFEAGIKSGDTLIIEYVDNVWPSLEMLPQSKCFKIFPSVEQMAKMTVEDLKSVENLMLENENGKIVFEGPVDVLGLDFDKLLKIDPMFFEGYPENSMADKLNKAALVHLYNIKPGKHPGKMEVNLRVNCEEQGTEFVKYDPVKEEFIFRILHI